MGEGLKCARLIMVLASMTPLFVIWAIRGSACIEDSYFISMCIFFVLFPNLILYLRIRTAKENNNTKIITVKSVKDQTDNLLLYLFAMLTPLISGDLDHIRPFFTMIGALVFLIFLFWHLNLFYLNIVFALFGYKIYTIYSNESTDDFKPFILLSKKFHLSQESQLITWRISDSIFIDSE